MLYELQTATVQTEIDDQQMGSGNTFGFLDQVTWYIKLPQRCYQTEENRPYKL